MLKGGDAMQGSHFIIKGEQFETYRIFVGNASLPMMMRYSHISPDHLQDAIQFGPTLQ